MFALALFVRTLCKPLVPSFKVLFATYLPLLTDIAAIYCHRLNTGKRCARRSRLSDMWGWRMYLTDATIELLLQYGGFTVSSHV
jgi:hypothetical protein